MSTSKNVQTLHVAIIYLSICLCLFIFTDILIHLLIYIYSFTTQGSRQRDLPQHNTAGRGGGGKRRGECEVEEEGAAGYRRGLGVWGRWENKVTLFVGDGERPVPLIHGEDMLAFESPLRPH